MISKDYNHPSVVMYSIGNEITELGLATGQEQARIMTEFCHTQDHTRPVTAGINLMLATMAKSKKKYLWHRRRRQRQKQWYRRNG